jgi:hypothetical protein
MVNESKVMSSDPDSVLVFEAVCRAIQSFNAQLPSVRKLSLTPECELVGSSDLDSLELVNLFVMIEQQIEQDLEVGISLIGGENQEGLEGFRTVQDIVRFLAPEVSRRKRQPT